MTTTTPSSERIVHEPSKGGHAVSEVCPESPVAAALDLRPTEYPSSAMHPSPSPCPAWCEYIFETGVDDLDIPHELDVRAAGGDVVHRSNPVDSRASMYKGRTIDQLAQFATCETLIETFGAWGDVPTVRISLRDWEYPARKMHFRTVLRLSLEDAEELAKVLNYLVGLAGTARG